MLLLQVISAIVHNNYLILKCLSINALYITYRYILYTIVSRINSSDVTVYESNGIAMIMIERSGLLNSDIMVNITTMDGTALG